MADGDESDRLARILFNAFEKNTSGAIVKRWLKITVDKCVFTCERPLSEVPPPLAQFIVDSIHRSIYSSTFVGEFVPRFHKDEPTEKALCASSHVFSREKPPWRRGCNPLFSLPPFPARANEDGLPAATRPNPRKYVYAATPESTALAIVLHASSLLPFFRIIQEDHLQEPLESPLKSAQTEGVGERLIPGSSLDLHPCVLWAHPIPSRDTSARFHSSSFLVDRPVKFSTWWRLSWYKYGTDARL